MNQTRYDAATSVLVLNARQITAFSAEERPIRFNWQEKKVEKQIQHGGGVVSSVRKAVLVEVTVSLQAGSDDSNFCKDLYTGSTAVEGSFMNIGTEEIEILSGGHCVNRGEVGRGFQPSADEYVFEFVASAGI